MKKIVIAAFLAGVFTAHSATAETLDDVISRCVNQHTSQDYVVYSTKVKEGKTYLRFGRKSQISDAEKAAVHACVGRSAPTVNAHSATETEQVTASLSIPRTRVTKRKSSNPLCPKHAAAMYRGTIYCIGTR